MNRKQKSYLIFTLLAVLLIVVLAGCGNTAASGAGNKDTAATQQQPSPAQKPTEQANSTNSDMSSDMPGMSTPAPAPSDNTNPAPADSAKLDGKALFLKTAAGVGCARCHGESATGTDIAPSIAGKTADQVKYAIGSVGNMDMFQQLSDQEIGAIANYLQTLKK